MTEQTPGCGSNSEARKRATTPLDECGYPEGVMHAHVEQCHRGERTVVLAEHLAARAERDAGLGKYLATMDNAGGGIYTADFREGFRHALAMLAAFESDEQPVAGRVRPEVREAARLALSRCSTIWCCPGADTMAHVRGCVNHPEAVSRG